MAIEHNGVVGEGFHIVAFPVASKRARFLLLCDEFYAVAKIRSVHTNHNP